MCHCWHTVDKSTDRMHAGVKQKEAFSDDGVRSPMMMMFRFPVRDICNEYCVLLQPFHNQEATNGPKIVSMYR